VHNVGAVFGSSPISPSPYLLCCLAGPLRALERLGGFACALPVPVHCERWSGFGLRRFRVPRSLFAGFAEPVHCEAVDPLSLLLVAESGVSLPCFGSLLSFACAGLVVALAGSLLSLAGLLGPLAGILVSLAGLVVSLAVSLVFLAGLLVSLAGILVSLAGLLVSLAFAGLVVSLACDGLLV
jgi:hypothetical protein